MTHYFQNLQSSTRMDILIVVAITIIYLEVIVLNIETELIDTSDENSLMTCERRLFIAIFWVLVGVAISFLLPKYKKGAHIDITLFWTKCYENIFAAYCDIDINFMFSNLLLALNTSDSCHGISLYHVRLIYANLHYGTFAGHIFQWNIYSDSQKKHTEA
ncbi:hypothetical protein ACJX0J_013866 [Zea mays]